MIKSVYIHIPFCTHICSYCDFPKVYYDCGYTKKYLKVLKEEIKQKYKGEIIDTLYIGGGTPSSLNILELKELFEITKIFKLSENYEFTFECNLENLNEEKLRLFQFYKVNRLSIGVQTFNKKFSKFLSRESIDTKIIKTAQKLGFNNINVDLIYAIPNQTINDLKKDLAKFIKLNISHLSTYSLMIEPNTLLGINYIEPIDEDLDYDMYKYICKFMKQNGFKHYEISNFAKVGFESKHNLTYWNNEEYYGFGMGASSYINDERTVNTKSITKYINNKYEYQIDKLDKRSKMEYEMILGLRKIDGVDLKKFQEKYKKDVKDVFDIESLLKKGELKLENNHLKIPEKYLYISNDILISFIDV